MSTTPDGPLAQTIGMLAAFAMVRILLVMVLLPNVAWATPPAAGWELGAGVNYAYLASRPEDDLDGGGVALGLGYGISDQVDLRASILWTQLPGDPGSQVAGADDSVVIIAVDLGLGYAIDAIPLAPRLEAALSLLHRRQSGAAVTDPGVKLGITLGASIWAGLWVGFGVHYRGFLADLASIPAYIEMGPRIAWTWGRPSGR